ncbi:MAG: hypothetical protein ABI641_07335 [Caldimonas sp.]
MRGGPIDLTPFGVVLTGIAWIYWLLAIVALVVAVRSGSTRRSKLMLATIVVLLFGFIPGREAWQGWQAKRALDESIALFEERCKTAGETVERTVDDIEGIVWMRWREEYSNSDGFADQWKLNDPYGRDCGLEDCIAKLLRVTSGEDLNPEEAKRHVRGYAFVETTDPRDGQRYRYTAHMAHGWSLAAVERHRKATGEGVPYFSYRFALDRVPISSFSAHYGVFWNDISTHKDRDHWIAGGSVKVVDLNTNQAIAEKTGYMLERGQGSRAGGRSPWLLAVQNACPPFANEPGVSRRGRTLNETLSFIVKVLHPA